MHCSEFLDRFSDYADGRLSDHRLARRIEAHLARCARCARRAASLEAGLHHLRSGGVTPSPSFHERLRRRLHAEVAIGDPVIPTGAGLAAALLMAAGVGLVLSEGLTRGPSDDAPAARTSVAAFSDTVLPAPPPVELDVTLPPFTGSTIEFSSSQVPLGTQVVFSP